MTAIAVAGATSSERNDHYADYLAHLATLDIGSDAKRLRRNGARALLARHPNLQRWIDRPIAERLVDISRAKAWPFICWAILAGRIGPDLELLIARRQGGMHVAVEAAFADGFAQLRDAAGRLGWKPRWVEAVIVGPLTLAVAFTGRAPQELTDADLDTLAAGIGATMTVSADRRSRLERDIGRLRQVLYEAKVIDRPHRRRGGPVRDPFAAVAAVGIRRVIVAYLEARRPTLRPGSLAGITNDLACFGEFLATHEPGVARLAELERSHIEAFCAWVPARAWRGGKKPGATISASAAAHNVISVRNFLDDITAWGWADAPRRRLVFGSDIPRQPDPLPRALPPDIDAAGRNAVANLDDPVARIGLTVIRATGLRVGELVDLELDCVVDYGAHGSWLRVPLGKLATERSVPLDDPTLAALDEWIAQRGPQRAIPHPRHGRLTDFLFVEHGQQPPTARLRLGLARAVAAAGLTGPDGTTMRVTPHQLRHTFATSLANAGMSLQALMALLGHASPEMTLRYARLASPTVKAAYDQAIGKLARRIPVSAAGRPRAPEREAWLRSEMLKTRVAHGYCSRDLVAEACPYANICETCPSYTTTAEFAPAIDAQLADIRSLRDDAAERGWHSEIARHDRVIASLDGHLRRLNNPR
jgi:integrase